MAMPDWMSFSTPRGLLQGGTPIAEWDVPAMPIGPQYGLGAPVASPSVVNPAAVAQPRPTPIQPARTTRKAKGKAKTTSVRMSGPTPAAPQVVRTPLQTGAPQPQPVQQQAQPVAQQQPIQPRQPAAPGRFMDPRFSGAIPGPNWAQQHAPNPGLIDPPMMVGPAPAPIQPYQKGPINRGNPLSDPPMIWNPPGIPDGSIPQYPQQQPRPAPIISDQGVAGYPRRPMPQPLAPGPQVAGQPQQQTAPPGYVWVTGTDGRSRVLVPSNGRGGAGPIRTLR